MKATAKLSTATINAIGAWAGQSVKTDNSKTKAIDSLLERVHELDAQVAKARENAKPIVEDPYKVPRTAKE